MSETPSQAAIPDQSALLGVLPPGTRLRTYELFSVLGHGGFGITYRARDLQLDREVAIKEYLPISLALRNSGTMVVPRSTEAAEGFVWGRDRFLEEARTLARLSEAPSIVRVYDFLEANGTAYMVMALARGDTLQQRLESQGRLPAAAIEALLYPLLEGLEQVHATGFLHRDIKPANLLLDDKGRPTLIDFGASRAAIAGRTATMTAVYTPGYAAVEQMTSAKQGPWTDIYGLSATLYHAITGAPPPGSIDRILNDACTPLLQLAPAGFSPALLSGVDAGLGVRAEQRPQSIADWRQLLQPAAPVPAATVAVPRRRSAQVAEPPAAPTQPAPVAPAPPMPAPAKRRVALWGAIAAAVMVLAGGGYLATSLFQDQATQRAAADKDAKAKAADATAAKQRADEAARLQAEAASTKGAAEQKRLYEDAARQTAEAKQKTDGFRQHEEDTRRQNVEAAATPKTALLGARPADRISGHSSYDLDELKKVPITLIVYSSFTCTHCADFVTRVLGNREFDKKWLSGDKVTLIYRDFPLDQTATKAAQLAKCVAPGAYYPVVHSIFANQPVWTAAADPIAELSKTLRELGMDDNYIKACLASDVFADAVMADYRGGEALGVNSTPALFINGQQYRGERSVEALDALFTKLDADRKKAESAGSAGASTQSYEQLRKECFDEATTDNRRIQGCNAVIASNQETQGNKSVAFSNRGLGYQHLSQYDRAIQDYDQAIELRPDNANAFYGRGLTYRRLNQFDRAIQDYDQAIKLNPYFLFAFNNRGYVYLLLKQYERAIPDFDQAIKQKPDFSFAFNNRGEAYLGLKQYDRAIQDFSQAIRFNPNSASAYKNRGDAYERKGQLDLAKADRDKAALLEKQGH